MLFFITLCFILVSSMLFTELYDGINILTVYHLDDYLDLPLILQPIRSTTQNAEDYFNVLNSLNYQSEIYLLSENYPEAIETYDKILKINPYIVSAWYGKIYALEKIGKYDEASILLIDMKNIFK